MKEPHVWTPASDPPRQPASEQEQRKQAEMERYLHNTMNYLRTLPKREERVDG